MDTPDTLTEKKRSFRIQDTNALDESTLNEVLINSPPQLNLSNNNNNNNHLTSSGSFFESLGSPSASSGDLWGSLGGSSGILSQPPPTAVRGQYDTIVGRSNETAPKEVLNASASARRGITRTGHGKMSLDKNLGKQESADLIRRRVERNQDLQMQMQKARFASGDDYLKTALFLEAKQRENQGHSNNSKKSEETLEGLETDAGLLKLVNDLEKNEIAAFATMNQSDMLDFLNSKALPKFYTQDVVHTPEDEDLICSDLFVQDLDRFSQCHGLLRIKNMEKVGAHSGRYSAQLAGLYMSWFTENDHEPVENFLISAETEFSVVMQHPNTFRVGAYQFSCPDRKSYDAWCDAFEKSIQAAKNPSTNQKQKSIKLRKFFITHTVNAKKTYFLLLDILLGEEVLITILRSLEQLKHLHQRLSTELPLLEIDGFPDPPLADDDPSFVQYLQGYFNKLMSHPEIQQNLALRAFLSTLPTDLTRRLLTVNFLQLREVLVDGHTDLSNISANICLVNDKKFRVSDMISVPATDLEGRWDHKVTFNMTNPAVAGVLIEFSNTRKSTLSAMFGNIFIPRSALVYKLLRHTFPIHPVRTHTAVAHGIADIDLRLTTHGDYQPPRVPEKEKYEQPAFREARERERKIAQQRVAGYIHVEYVYYPPTHLLDGALLVRVLACKNLDSKDANGKSDPYVCLEIVENGLRHCFILLDSQGNKYKPKKYTEQSPLDRLGALTRTRTIKENLDPVYNETFVFVIKPHAPWDAFFLDVNVWDYDRVGGDDFIGNYQIFEPDIVPCKTTREWYPLAGIFTEEDMPKKVGQTFRERGFKPKYPIVLVPGFCSSGLKVVEGDKNWIDQRIWLSLTKLTAETKAARAFRWSKPPPKQNDNDSDLEKETPEYKNRWLMHMTLANDGCADKQGFVLRPVPGTDGIAYLAPGKLTNALSYVMGPLIENLKEVGYVEGKNLFAASYDWRIPPYYNEIRDQYFSRLAKAIEELVSNNDETPVCIVAHSMGNRTTQYFLNYAESHLGRGWLERHVHNFIAVGAPFLGAPKSIRGLASGERLGLETFLSEDDGLVLARSIGSTPFLFPVGCSHYFDKNLHGDTDFIYLKQENDSFSPISLDFCLTDSGAERQLYQFDDYYMKNPLFGGHHESECKIIKCPPVKRMTVIYGINLRTEVKYFYAKNKKGQYVLTSPKDASRYPVYKIKDGTAYEHEHTPQHFIKILTGIDGTKSGDGTVPYASLAYPEFWRDDLEQLDIVELYGAEHREILNNRLLFHHVIVNTCQSPKDKQEEAKALGGSAHLRAHNFKVQTFKTPTYCKFCSGFLWGVFKQGYECTNCLYPAHKQCYGQVGPTCTTEKPSLLDQGLEKISMGKDRVEYKANLVKEKVVGKKEK